MMAACSMCDTPPSAAAAASQTDTTAAGKARPTLGAFALRMAIDSRSADSTASSICAIGPLGSRGNSVPSASCNSGESSLIAFALADPSTSMEPGSALDTSSAAP